MADLSRHIHGRWARIQHLFCSIEWSWCSKVIKYWNIMAKITLNIPGELLSRVTLRGLDPKVTVYGVKIFLNSSKLAWKAVMCINVHVEVYSVSSDLPILSEHDLTLYSITWHGIDVKFSGFVLSVSSQVYWKLHRDPPLFARVICEQSKDFPSPYKCLDF